MNVRRTSPDQGAVLPLVLIFVVALSIMVGALAQLIIADLGYGEVSQTRSERLSTALSAVDYSVERLRADQTLCGAGDFGAAPDDTVQVGVVDVGDDRLLPPDMPSISISCTTDTPLRATDYGLVLTGTDGAAPVLSSFPGSIQIDTDSGSRAALRPGNVVAAQGLDDPDLWRLESVGGCPQGTIWPGGNRGVFCSHVGDASIIGSPPLAGVPTEDAALVSNPTGCRVYAPGVFHSSNPPVPVGDTYFMSGVYILRDVDLVVNNGDSVWFGRPQDTDITQDPVTGNYTVPSNNGCTGTYPGPTPTSPVGTDTATPRGVVVYLCGSSSIQVQSGGEMAIFGRDVGGSRLTVVDGHRAGVPNCDPTFGELRTADGTHLLSAGSVFLPSHDVWLGRNCPQSNCGPSSRDRDIEGNLVAASLTVGKAWKPLTLTSATVPAPGTAQVEVTATDADGGTTTVTATVSYDSAATDPEDRAELLALDVAG